MVPKVHLGSSALLLPALCQVSLSPWRLAGKCQQVSLHPHPLPSAQTCCLQPQAGSRLPPAAQPRWQRLEPCPGAGAGSLLDKLSKQSEAAVGGINRRRCTNVWAQPGEQCFL